MTKHKGIDPWDYVASLNRFGGYGPGELLDGIEDVGFGGEDNVLAFVVETFGPVDGALVAPEPTAGTPAHRCREALHHAVSEGLPVVTADADELLSPYPGYDEGFVFAERRDGSGPRSDEWVVTIYGEGLAPGTKVVVDVRDDDEAHPVALRVPGIVNGHGAYADGTWTEVAVGRSAQDAFDGRGALEPAEQ